MRNVSHVTRFTLHVSLLITVPNPSTFLLAVNKLFCYAKLIELSILLRSNILGQNNCSEAKEPVRLLLRRRIFGRTLLTLIFCLIKIKLILIFYMHRPSSKGNERILCPFKSPSDSARIKTRRSRLKTPPLKPNPT